MVTPPLGATGSMITTAAEGDAVALCWLSRAAVIAEQTTGSRDQRYSFSDCPAGQAAKLPSGAKISNKAFISSHLSRSKPDLDRPLAFFFFLTKEMVLLLIAGSSPDGSLKKNKKKITV